MDSKKSNGWKIKRKTWNPSKNRVYDILGLEKYDVSRLETWNMSPPQRYLWYQHSTNMITFILHGIETQLFQSLTMKSK
jgi:hypothetical protein